MYFVTDHQHQLEMVNYNMLLYRVENLVMNHISEI